MSGQPMARQARVERKTKETDIVLHLNIDGTGAAKIQTGIPFFGHMLEAWSKHGLVDLTVDAHGDLEVDLHHTVEDVGIVLGKALREALGDRRGIVRFGSAAIPMDEALVSAAVDISGRPFIVFNVPLTRARIANFDLDLLKDFFRAFAFNAELNLHVNLHYGENLHHIAGSGWRRRSRRTGAWWTPRTRSCCPATAPSTTPWRTWARSRCCPRFAARSMAGDRFSGSVSATSSCSRRARSLARGVGSTSSPGWSAAFRRDARSRTWAGIRYVTGDDCACSRASPRTPTSTSSIPTIRL